MVKSWVACERLFVASRRVEVLKMDELAVDQQRGASVGEVGSLDPSLATGVRPTRSSRAASAGVGKHFAGTCDRIHEHLTL